MADVDPDTLLEWLQMGQGDERDMQLIALEQLCMLLLMSDNVDRCFETKPLPCKFQFGGYKLDVTHMAYFLE
ncbi:E3 ubiquitin-protein ligase HECTD1 [Myotis brandtii]|uniref:E3 ubiquitin-protein ligase n=1 Tax=Myotis brandtii TaxID=109478 RepID=S7NHX2_MYOBR|nr:E3 ubiquitin-protein ligase HECTD1 [Myotis brandtii]